MSVKNDPRRLKRARLPGSPINLTISLIEYMMDTRIFDQGLSMEATSAYIIIDALQNGGGSPHLSVIRPRWNGSEDDLAGALNDLLAHQVIALEPGSGEADPVYRATPYFRWKPTAPWPPPKGLPVFGDD